MFTIGMDVDTLLGFVSTELFQINFEEREKILLYAGNSFMSSPPLFSKVGKIYSLQYKLKGQSAGNFGFSSNATAVTKNTYNKSSELPKISEHVPNHINNLNDIDLGFFLAGLIEGDG